MKRKIISLIVGMIFLMTLFCGCKVETVAEHNKVKGESTQSEVSSDKGKNEKKDSVNKEVEADKASDKSNNNSSEKTATSKVVNSSQKSKANAEVKSNSSTVSNIPKEAPSQSNSKKYVTITIRCDTILKNWDELDQSLRSERFVPKNGAILKETKYEIKDNETVFDVLVKATRANRIHMEHQAGNLNKYGSSYIQGINHIYEFSCGKLSGWMYSVNNSYPNYGCNKYILKDGDAIKWNYTCDLGRDLGVTWLDK